MEPDPELEEFATRLFDLARSGRTEALCAYVDAGVPVDLRNQKGDTLLMLAAYHGHAATVRALGERGADPDLANDRGQTPLAGAVFKRSPRSCGRCWSWEPIATPGCRRPSTPPACSGTRRSSPSSRNHPAEQICPADVSVIMVRLAPIIW
ncbi:hypothetical protein Misp03_03310 [Microbispora sp. NBRC 16548]|nr:hypothetical protein Misp03_03310 [Microbispora sp. NBRC 16548]